MTFQHRKMEKKSDHKKCEKEEEICSLMSFVDYYQTKKLPAKRFLSFLKNNEIDVLQKQDIKLCLEQLDKNDPDFARTLEIFYCALNTQTKLGRQLVDFGSQACRQQLKAHCNVNIDLEQPANVIFEGILLVLKPKLCDKKPNTLLLNLLKLFGLYLNHTRNLNEFELISLLVAEFVPQNSGKDNQLSNSIDVLFKPSTSLKIIIDTLIVTNSSLSKVKLAKDSESCERQQRQKEQERVQVLQKQLDEAKSELSKKEQSILELLSNLEQSKIEKESLEKKIQDIQTVNTFKKNELEGRCRVFLDRKILPLLENALEATDLEPPRKNIITERLEMAKEQIMKEIKWLSTD
ncbi:MAG: hypothetical protein RIT27_1944 [Pseudomonadota bacterium]